MPKQSELTDKMLAFAHRDVELGNGQAAYKAVYNAENMNDKSISVEVAKLRGDPRITLVQDEIRAELAERNAVSVDSLSKELDGAIKMATNLEQPSPAVTGIMGKAKLHGFLTDNIKHSGEVKVNCIQVEFE